MRISRAIPPLLMFAALACMWPRASYSQDQRELERQLYDGNAQVRYRATVEVERMGPEGADPRLRTALIEVLDREAETFTGFLRGAGQRPEEPELLARLVRVVAVFEDPRAIRPIAAALGTGSSIRPLAAFGEPALDAVLEAIAATQNISVAQDALLTLRFMTEGVGKDPISVHSRERLVDVAQSYLRTDLSVTLLWLAMDLAWALDDPELMAIVEAIASDPEEVIQRGITDPDLIERTQRHAADRLAGIPPLPRW